MLHITCDNEDDTAFFAASRSFCEKYAPPLTCPTITNKTATDTKIFSKFDILVHMLNYGFKEGKYVVTLDL
jgi:hypothetical protein